MSSRLTRREFLKAGLGAMAGAVISPWLDLPQPEVGDGSVPELARPNLVYILADQLRACSVGCYGNGEVSTPHIDGLAAQGARFANAVSTSPLCTPHRACLITGRYPTVHGVTQNAIKLPPSEVGIAEVLGPGGYLTQYIGKWHLNGPTPNPSQDPGWVAPKDRQGFQKWQAFNMGHVYYGGHYYQDKDPAIQTIPTGVYEPDFQTEQAIGFITANQLRRFCLFLSIGTPHPGAGPDLPPGGDYAFPYDPNNLTLPPNVDYPDGDYSRQEYADYYGTVSNLDWNVGRILTTLDSLGLASKTIVAISSDHGDYLGAHYGTIGVYRGKARIEAECLDVPFLLRFPGKVAPQVVSDVFASVDIMPTLLGLCALPVSPGVMGRDFSPLLRGSGAPIEPPWGPVPSTESALIGMFAGDWVGLRTQEFSLECDRVTLVPTRMFHNASDPYQMTNVVDDPAYEPVRNALHDEFLAWMDYVQPPR